MTRAGSAGKWKAGMRMQDVRFSNVDECLDSLEGEERKIAYRLRELVLDCIPGVTEKLSYNVPFYKRLKNICFIWPGSIAWAGKKQPGVRLGFNQGYRMKAGARLLDQGDRKQVYWIDFVTLKSVDDAVVRMLLFEAVSVDDETAAVTVKGTRKK